jgi:hypothetical protein
MIVQQQHLTVARMSASERRFPIKLFRTVNATGHQMLDCVQVIWW